MAMISLIMFLMIIEEILKDMKINKCKCGSHDLEFRYDISANKKWIICNNCNNTFTPILTCDYNEVIEKWNTDCGIDESEYEIETEDYIVRFNDNKDIRDRVFDAVIKWCFDYGLFSGECIHQCDSGQIESPILLSDIVDNIIKFDVEYKD